MKTLILPAEIKSRELDARLLNAVVACRRGWRVITGSKALINRAIWRLPRGVYLCQTLTAKRASLLRLLEQAGFVSIGWDEEGLVYFGRDIYLARRVAPQTLARLATVIAWGEASRNDLDERAGQAATRAVAIGNPRIDLLRKELRGLHAAECAALKAQHGSFILINSNFSGVNPMAVIGDARSAVKKPVVAGEEAALDRFAAMHAYRGELFKHFVALARDLARAMPDQKVIVRPHPAEDPAAWRSSDGPDNLHIIRQGPVIPWLMAAGAIIHNGCTTAVEAACLDRAPIAYCPLPPAADEAPLPNAVSVKAHDRGEVERLTAASLAGKLRLGDGQRQTLDNHIAALDGPLASERMVDVCEQLALPARAPSPSWRGYAAARAAWKKVRLNHVTDRYIARVFPPTPVEEVRHRAQAIAAEIGGDADFNVRQVARNIFELAPWRRP